MDIKISIVLKDKTYGFSDLLDGRELNNQTKEEIIHLIKEDIGYVFDQQIEVEQLTLTDVVVPFYCYDADERLTKCKKQCKYCLKLNE